ARAAARERCLARVVPGAGPRSEQDQQPRSIRGANRSPLGRIELEERPRRRGDRALRRVDLDLAVDDDDPCPLSHLVLAELLSGIEPDQYRAAVLGVENDRRPRTVRHFDLVQVPGAHAANLTDAKGRPRRASAVILFGPTGARGARPPFTVRSTTFPMPRT